VTRVHADVTTFLVINLLPIIERIRTLLNEDTDQSVTYAALEARLALEKVCYDRLRQAHDYISHDQLKKWQPGGVVNTLMKEVDPHVATTRTLSMSKSPAEPGVELTDYDYVELGTEVGFNANKVAKMWQALAKLALHVRLPEHKNDHIPDYGDRIAIRRKVEEVVAELERLSNTTMMMSGMGDEVRFDCSCGETNRRRSELLEEGQSVSCINPECVASWTVSKGEDGFSFNSEAMSITCTECGKPNLLHKRNVMSMAKGEVASFSCHTCGHKNFFMWKLMQAQLPSLAAQGQQTGV
jgi:hypothetical protein